MAKKQQKYTNIAKFKAKKLYNFNVDIFIGDTYNIGNT